METSQLKETLAECKAKGQKTAICFCSHVPREILEAAGFWAIRIRNVDDYDSTTPNGIPNNICPIVKETYSLFTDDTLKDADLIIAETSCDGKKKVYELIYDQERVYYYQIPQGEENEYSTLLIRSEIQHLIKYLESHFDVEITDKKIREASIIANAEREAILSLLKLQVNTDHVIKGTDIYDALLKSRDIVDPVARLNHIKNRLAELSSKNASGANDLKRILVTGCPLSGVYDKVIGTVENNGGIVASIENCDVINETQRFVDTDSEDIIQALVDCYRRTPCAIMTPNPQRFELLRNLIDEYKIDGVIDVSMTTCHAYTVESYNVKRLCEGMNIPNIAIVTDLSMVDMGQVSTRIAAFIEML